MAEARAAYRALQRTVSKQLSSERGNQWQIFVREYFRRSAKGESTEILEQKLQLAEDCADLLSSVKNHKVTLLIQGVSTTVIKYLAIF